jgi:lysozyme
MGTLIGLDVSVYQGNVDWEKAKSAGCQFAFIRCTFGVKVDTQFKRNWAEAKRVGIPRGAYGWCIDKMNQVSNATLFWEQIKNDPGELPPVVDFEKYGATYVGFSALQLYVETLEKLGKRKPIIYTSKGYWTSLADYKNQYWALSYPFWLAQYTTSMNPVLPLPFTHWDFWQYSADGNNRGYEFGAESASIDINRFNGDIIDLYKLMGADIVDPNDPLPTNDLKDLSARVVNMELWARGIGYKG